MFKSDRNTLLSFVITAIIVTLLSLLGLAYSIYSISVVLAISSLFSFLYLLLNLKFANKYNNSKENIRSIYIVWTLLRILLLVLAIVLSSLRVYYASDIVSLGETRLLISLFAFVPIAISFLYYYFRSLSL